MKKIYTHQTLAIVYSVKNVLENAGIQTFIKNEHSSGAAGGLVPHDCWPELWIIDDSQEQQALTLAREAST